jgi:hypothetical protein
MQAKHNSSTLSKNLNRKQTKQQHFEKSTIVATTTQLTIGHILIGHERGLGRAPNGLHIEHVHLDWLIL